MFALLRMRDISGVSSMASLSNRTSSEYGTLYADPISDLLSAGVGSNSTVPSPTCSVQGHELFLAWLDQLASRHRSPFPCKP